MYYIALADWARRYLGFLVLIGTGCIYGDRVKYIRFHLEICDYVEVELILVS